MTRSAFLEQLATAIAGVRVDHPTRVAIDGVDGAGKTRLADELAGALAATGRQIIRASIDGFHHPKESRYRRGAESAEGYFLDSFDYAALKSELLDPLGPRGSRRFRSAVFDHRTDRRVNAAHGVATPDAVLLVDGVFLQRSELADSWDLRIWVEVPFDVTVPRAVERDAVGQDAEIVLARYRRRYVPGQVMYLRQCRPREAAHIVADNADFENPDLRFHRPNEN
jgi:uridine kinase